MRTQVCSNEGPCQFPRGNKYEIGKIHWQNIKIFLCRTTGSISTKHRTLQSWVKGIHVCSNEVPRPFPRGDNYDIENIHWWNKKKTVHKASLSDEDSSFSKWKAPPFSKGRLLWNGEYTLTNLTKIFSRTTQPISSKFCTKHHCVMRIHVFQNEGPCPFPRGDNYEIAKCIDTAFKIFFSRTT